MTSDAETPPNEKLTDDEERAADSRVGSECATLPARLVQQSFLRFRCYFFFGFNCPSFLRLFQSQDAFFRNSTDGVFPAYRLAKPDGRGAFNFSGVDAHQSPIPLLLPAYQAQNSANIILGESPGRSCCTDQKRGE